jgi:hypothetical protein
LPQPIIDDVRKAIAARTPAATRRGGAAQSQEEINAIVKRKIAQIRDLGVQIVFGTDVGSWGRSRGRQRGWKRISDQRGQRVRRLLTDGGLSSDSF